MGKSRTMDSPEYQRSSISLKSREFPFLPVVAMPLAGGAHASFVELGTGPLRLRVTRDELLVEGGDELLRFVLPTA